MLHWPCKRKEMLMQYKVPTPIIDAMITLAGAMHNENFFTESRYDLAYLGIANLSKAELLDYLNEGKLTSKQAN